jgi:hypothetical protein
MTVDQKEFPALETEDAKTKKLYVAPELIVHGAVQKLTEHTGTGNRNEQSMQQRS